MAAILKCFFEFAPFYARHKVTTILADEHLFTARSRLVADFDIVDVRRSVDVIEIYVTPGLNFHKTLIAHAFVFKTCE